MLPQLFKIGPFTLYSFGLMVVLGFALGVYLAARLARERGLDGEAFVDGAVVILFAAIAGARLLFVMLNSREFAQHLLQIAALWQGGMSFHGGAVAGLLAGWLYIRHRKLPALAMADAAAPGIALGYAVGRIGCFLNGCCFGGPTTLPWGVHFSGPGTEPGLHYHPTQIYATLINLGLTAALVWVYRREHKQGQVLALYIAAYSVYRFFIEALRKGYTAEVFAFGLTESQVFSIVCLVAAGGWWLWLQRRGRPAPLRTSAAPPAGPAADPAPELAPR
jgi:phosphatidylglycerol:prolipoprotein diacylglycerol transferase